MHPYEYVGAINSSTDGVHRYIGTYSQHSLLVLSNPTKPLKKRPQHRIDVPTPHKSHPHLSPDLKHKHKPITRHLDRMAPEHTVACTLALPPEIWRIVLHSFGAELRDLIELWTGCRGVSKHFKHEVEQLFIADYLPRTCLRFAITTCQAFDRNSRIKFQDHEVETFHKRTSVDRARAFFRAKDDNKAKPLKQMHNGGVFSGPSHVVDLSRPNEDVALPGVFFHANGDVEVDWRELFAAVLAELKYFYRVDCIADWQVSREVSRHHREAFAYDQKQVIQENASRNRQADMFESNMNNGTQAETLYARVFRVNIVIAWDKACDSQ